MDCSMPGFPVHHQLPELTQTHVHRVGDVIQQSHPLLSPSPLAFNLSQHRGLFPMSQFASGVHSIGVSASVLPMNIQDWSPLGWTGWISLQSKGLLRVFSNTTVQKRQFFGIQLSLYIIPLKLPILLFISLKQASIKLMPKEHMWKGVCLKICVFLLCLAVLGLCCCASPSSAVKGRATLHLWCAVFSVQRFLLL